MPVLQINGINLRLLHSSIYSSSQKSNKGFVFVSVPTDAVNMTDVISERSKQMRFL